MLEFFTSISNAVQVAISFLGSMVGSTLSVFGLIGEAYLFLQSIVVFLPPLLVVFAGAGIAVSIIFLVIGR